MQAKNKIKPTLLSDPDQVKFYQVKIDLGNGRWAELNFSEKVWALNEYNRIKSASIYCDSWIKSITLEELANDLV